MKKQLKIFLHIGIILTTLTTASMSSAVHAAEHLDRIVAIVNDSVITQSELNEAIDKIKVNFKRNNASLPTSDVLHKQVLDQIVNKKLQLQLAEQMGVRVTDADVEKAISGIAKGNKVTVSELYQKVAEQGISKQEYLKNIREELIIHHVQQQAVGSKLIVAPQEVEAFMRSKTWLESNSKEYHLEDILIALPDAPSPQDVAKAKKRAEDTLAKIRGGLSFSQAAAAESGEPNALQGGDLGWRKLPEIPNAFASELLHMKDNDIAGPIQASNGFHIFRLAGVRNVGKAIDAAQQRAQVQQLLFQRKVEESLQHWIMKLRSEAFINTNPEK